MFVRLAELKVKLVLRLQGVRQAATALAMVGRARLEKRVSVGLWQRASCRRYRAYRGASPGIALLAGY